MISHLGVTPYNKMEKDGRIAVIYSPTPHKGWYLEDQRDEGILFDANIVQLVIDNDIDGIVNYCKMYWPSAPYKWADTLTIGWVEKGEIFAIDRDSKTRGENIIMKRAYAWHSA